MGRVAVLCLRQPQTNPGASFDVMTKYGIEIHAEWPSACKDTSPEIFFPVQGAAQFSARAKEICAECPGAFHCLVYAVFTNQEHGIWGGHGEEMRRPFRRQLAKRGPQPTLTAIEVAVAQIGVGVTPRMAKARNTSGATCGYIATKNRTCPLVEELGKPCRACQAAGHRSSLKRRAKALQGAS